MISYLDTSAAMKLLVEERESDALAEYLREDVRLCASWLLHTELHRAANCHPAAVLPGSVTLLLEAVTLVDVVRGDLLTAALLPGALRSHDALHLATALRVDVDEVLTYDLELAQAARAAGLMVTAP